MQTQLRADNFKIWMSVIYFIYNTFKIVIFWCFKYLSCLVHINEAISAAVLGIYAVCKKQTVKKLLKHAANVK